MDLSPKAENALNGNENLMMKEKGDLEADHEDVGNERHTWSKKVEYVLSMIGFCVGLGNIWRFPYVCMRNGGGAFLIPFIFSLTICAFPVYYLEVAMGQFLGKSPWHVWNICPLFRGIGLSMNIMCILMGWYYSIILGWSLIYMVNSFKSPLPWTQCGQSWNTPNCITLGGDRNSNNNLTNSTLELSSTTNVTAIFGNDSAIFGNDSAIFQDTETEANRTVVSSTEEFWQHNVLELTSGLHEMGGLPWHNAVALICANIVILAALIKGINSSGKVVYVTATLPYILIGVIFVMGCTLPGAGDGILFYIKPDFGKLLDFQTWIEAAIQVFYSLGAGWGSLITMSSYNKFNNNCQRDSVLLVIACEGTSVFGGFAIFSILGHMAHVAKVPITEFAKSGAGLAFIVYPEAIHYLPVSQLWGVLFFLMLFTVGLDTQFACIETIFTTIFDMWPWLMRRGRTPTTTVVMTIFTLAGFTFVARGGGYMFQIVDWYIAAFSLLIQCALESLIVAWVYGADRFCDDVKLMIGQRPPRVFVIFWKFVSPFVLMILFSITLVSYKPPTFAGYTFPPQAEVLGWFIAILPFMSIVVYAIFVLLTAKGSFVQRVKVSCLPPPDWAPSNPEARKQYRYASESVSDSDSNIP